MEKEEERVKRTCVSVCAGLHVLVTNGETP